MSIRTATRHLAEFKTRAIAALRHVTLSSAVHTAIGVVEAANGNHVGAFFSFCLAIAAARHR